MANSSPKPAGVRRLYVNLISISSIIMIAVGTVLLTQYMVTQMVGQKYQIYSFEEAQCQYDVPRSADPYYRPSDEMIQRAKEARDRCLQNLETIRLNRQVADLTAPLIFEVTGVMLFITHFGVLRKKWDA